MGEKEFNVKDSKISLYNYIINYITANRNRNQNRDQINFHINRNLYQNFVMVCQKLGLCPRGSRGNLAIEGFMQFMVEHFKDSPTTIQTTLFYKPKIEKVEVKHEQTVNIGVKLPVKIVVRDLEQLLKALEEKRGDHSFYLNKLRRTVEKASKLYNTTYDEQLKVLLEKAEKWI